MKQKPPLHESFYLSLANELAAKLRRINAFVSHGPSIGSYHEEALKTILRSVLPERFSLRTGFAYDAKNGASQQCDILVVDENHAGAYHFREGEFAVVLPQAVVCVIEVKTKLNKQSFCDSMKVLHSVGKVAQKHYVPSFLFAYDSQTFSPATLSSWYLAVTVPDEMKNYPWCVFALNQGVIALKYDQINKVHAHVHVEGDAKNGPKLRSLSLFLQTIRKAALLYSGSKGNPFEYAVLDGLSYGGTGYLFGDHKDAAVAQTVLPSSASTPPSP